MYANSKAVETDQDAVHSRLDETVLRHLRNQWKKPLAVHTVKAFEQALSWQGARGDRPLILDSGCGTARSSFALAAAHPDALVIGIDQSEARLSKARRQAPLPENLLLLRAECSDFWRLGVQHGWQLHRHYLLYPNPWPKAAHLKRRWHGHPAFLALLSLGGQAEVRSNWRLYLEEMSRAMNLAGKDASIQRVDLEVCPLSDFERKYRDSGHALYRLESNLSK